MGYKRTINFNKIAEQREKGPKDTELYRISIKAFDASKLERRNSQRQQALIRLSYSAAKTNVDHRHNTSYLRKRANELNTRLKALAKLPDNVVNMFEWKKSA